MTSSSSSAISISRLASPSSDSASSRFTISSRTAPTVVSSQSGDWPGFTRAPADSRERLKVPANPADRELALDQPRAHLDVHAQLRRYEDRAPRGLRARRALAQGAQPPAELGAPLERHHHDERLAAQVALAPLQDVDRGAVGVRDGAVLVGDDVGLARLLEEIVILLALACELVDLRPQLKPHGLQFLELRFHGPAFQASIRLRTLRG